MKVILIMIGLLVSLEAWSQSSVFGHFSFQLPTSVGTYRQTGNPDVGAGARMSIYLRPKPASPFQFGVDLGLFGRGRSTEMLPIEIAGFENNFKVTATNSTGNFGLLLKFEPLSSKRISPFLEGEVGENLFYSEAVVNRKNHGSEKFRLGKNDAMKGKWVPFYGGSAGVKIAMGKNRTGGFELKCAYFRGGQTSYNAKPRFGNDGSVVFEQLRSTTDMLVPQIGVWADFGKVKKWSGKSRQLHQ